MIDLNLFFALTSFYFVMYVTPGPNNAMVLTSGIKFGFSKTVPHMSGITIGHVLQVVIVCLGLGKLFQLVNPKAWTISSMVASGFLPKDENLITAIFFISITALIICPISISIWAAFGSGIRNLVKNDKKKAIVEYFLAILLLITAILIVLEK